MIKHSKPQKGKVRSSLRVEKSQNMLWLREEKEKDKIKKSGAWSWKAQTCSGIERERKRGPCDFLGRQTVRKESEETQKGKVKKGKKVENLEREREIML